jgi:hypothetical protein
VGYRLGFGSAGSRLRSQEGGKGGGGFRAAREGWLVFAFNARSGAVPLPPLCVVLFGMDEFLRRRGL